jgi:hypothetical protein
MKNNFSRFYTGLLRRFDQTTGRVGYLPLPVLVNGIPKSGTNLLKNIVLALPNATYSSLRVQKKNQYGLPEGLPLVKKRITDLRAGRVYAGHYIYSSELSEWLSKNKIKQVFLFRDPRDVAISTYHYIMERKIQHPHYEIYKYFEDDSTRLLKSIIGVGEGETSYKFSSDSLPNIRLFFEAFEGWLTDKNTLALRYEDLLLAKQDNSTQVIEKILKFLDVSYDNELLQKIIARGTDPNKSVTFRRGVSGGWRQEFKQIHIDTFKSIGADMLQRWGYGWE